MLRTAENAGLIAEIEGGDQEGGQRQARCAGRCAPSAAMTSTTGASAPRKGQVYGEKRCIVRLAEPTDAYEWSFVAVPAQPRAGVVKGFQPGTTLRQALAAWDRDGVWQAELDQLEKEAAAGRRHLEDLRRETVRLGLLAEPALGEATLQGIAGKLNQEELEALQACYTRRLEGAAPCRCSCTTAGRQPRRGGRDRSFVI